MRQIIEPAAAFDAAHCASIEDVAAIADAYAEMAALATDGAFEARVSADLAFHVAVADASGNRFFQSITRSIIHALRRSFEALIDPPGNYEANLANHRAVLDAIRIGDPEGAQAAMMRLLQRSEYAMERLSGRAIECEQDVLDEGKETS
ncbi:FCD domain-containing protein [Tranquillimonas alkanivorans]|uniref:FCD domain-containing protein n=2 Tax=Tranquillimonas alkanivorans TaxID=441119 RepID=A0A1I5VIP8_9RHOB|nr:FCD domain-containing protein [Tranquillimonas alkanivorans]